MRPGWTRMGRRAPLRIALLLVAASLAAAALVSPSAASPRLCRQLEAQLAGLGTGGSAGQARKYDRAIEAQISQIVRAERQLRRAGCGGGISIFSRDGGGSACEAISVAIDRMERNLGSLEQRRAQMGGGADPRRERARLLASIDANGCREAPPSRRDLQAMETPDRQGSLFDQLFGGDVSRRQTLDEYEQSDRVRPLIEPDANGNYSTFDGSGNDGGYDGGSYRTLCVRTCDGYYFPISYTSSRGDFDRDAQNCQTMCPGTDVKLFSHRVPEEESENMVASDGTAYTDLPTAFKYKDANFSRPATCGCNPVKNFSIIGGATASIEKLAVPGTAPAKPADPAAQPEAPAVAAANTEAEPATKPVASAAPTDRKVRVVGPAYLPDPEAALDLRAPAQKSIQ